MPIGISVTTSALIVLCAVIDIRSRRIPNLITFSGIIIGLALNGFYFGASGVVALILPSAVLSFWSGRVSLVR